MNTLTKTVLISAAGGAMLGILKGAVTADMGAEVAANVMMLIASFIWGALVVSYE